MKYNIHNILSSGYKMPKLVVKILFFLVFFIFLYFEFKNYNEYKTSLEKQEYYNNETNAEKQQSEDKISSDGFSDSISSSAINNAQLNSKISEIVNNFAKDMNPSDDNSKSSQKTKFLISIIIDDMGINQEQTRRIIDIKAPINSSFLTYASDLHNLTKQARNSGHEVIAHIPMEPLSFQNTSDDQLKTSMKNEVIRDNFNQMLDKFENINGCNNHMGSKFTENSEKMAVIMQVLKERNLYFIDSRTSAKSIGCDIAEKYKVECQNRSVFLDNENEYNYIMQQLKQTESVARKNGYAIAIGHPKSFTSVAIKDWLKNLNKNDFEVIHLSDLFKKIKKY